MRNETRQKSLDAKSEREIAQRSNQSRQKAVPQEAPLKEQGQPAWRDIKEE